MPELRMVNCRGCDRPILDKYLLNVSDQSWHPDCVTCCECKMKLTDKCFSREGKLFCRVDFFRKFGTKCSGCMQGIQPTDLVRRARSKVYHLQCFNCFICRKQLATGDELYLLDDLRFICKEDFLSSRHHHQSMNFFPNGPDSSTLGLSPMSPSSTLSDSGHGLDVRGAEGAWNSGMIGSPLPPNGDYYGMASPATGENDSYGANDSYGGLASPPPPPSTGNSSDAGGTSCTLLGGSRGRDLGNNGERNSGGSSSSGASTHGAASGANDEGTAGGTKRRGPRTTIKAKQLEILKTAFSNTPKPTRHIRETLAAETGLNMRVIQVWFQNRRSKERRMKQLSSMGARRHFFRSRAGRSPPVHGPHAGYHPHSGGPPSEPPYYDFYDGGSVPYPGDHPVLGSHEGQTVLPGVEPSLPGLESAGGWPMAQM